jgi:hypothetical protein
MANMEPEKFSIGKYLERQNTRWRVTAQQPHI